MEEKSMRDMFRLGFGEEVANCVTHGIMAFLCICSLPAAAVYSYNKSGSELAAGVSVFILCLFLMFLVSTLYHCMPFGTTHKYVFRKLDHICIYFAIAGSYTPIALTLIGGWQGYLILAIEWSAVLGGVLLKAKLKKLSQAFHDHLYDYGLDGYLLSADAAVKGKSSVSRIDCRRRCYVYDWRLLLWKATKKILSFRLACLYQSGKYSAFHCHRIRDVICQVRTGLKQKITPRALLTGL